MEHWRKTSCMEPVPLGRSSEKRKVQAGASKCLSPPPQRQKLTLSELPQHGHPQSRILEDGDGKADLGRKKTQTQSFGEMTDRARVMNILHRFREYCDQLSGMKRDNLKRVDLEAAKMVKIEFGCSIDKQYLGGVPGVQIGDKFYYRMELHILGLHRPPRWGIDTMDYGGEKIAISVVASGGYNDRWKDRNTLIYCGHGGNYASGNQDQKLESGNRALFNSIQANNPVRVIRGVKKMKANKLVRMIRRDKKMKACVTMYTYDGLYTVEDMWKTNHSVHRKEVFNFKLVKISGQS